MRELRLIDKLRFYAKSADKNIYGICVNSPSVMLQAADVIEELEKIIADSIHVVRCKECKYEQMCKNAQYLGMDGFCSYGERKIDD